MAYRILALAALLAAGFASSAQAQTPAPLDREELTRYARTYLALDAARQAFHAKIAGIHDDIGLARARAELEAEVAQIHVDHAITSERYAQVTLLVSQDATARGVFEEIVSQLRTAAR
jgi:hypothetical protein